MKRPRILDHLGKPKKVGSGFLAVCPCHDDHDPSLGIDVKGEAVLIVCRVCGANGKAVCEALGLDPAEYLYLGGLNSNGSGPGIEVARYRYTDAKGNALLDSVRYEPKAFRLYLPEQSSGGIGDTPRVLYRLPQLVAAVAAGETVYVVEGEKDVERLAAAGLTATTNPMGAGKWSRVDSSPLAGASVVVLPDNDEPGRKQAADVRVDLEAKGCSVKVVELPGLPEKGDVSDWLNDGGTADELRMFTEAATRDRFAHIQPIDFSTLADRVNDLEDQWLVEPAIAKGRRTHIFSRAGVGKSLLNLFMAACLAEGRACLRQPVGEPQHVAYLDSEMTEDDLSERLQDMGFDYASSEALQTHLHYYLHAGFPPLDTAEGGEAVLAVAQRDAAVHVFIDTVTSQTQGAENDADTYRNMGRHTTARLVGARIGVTILDHEGKDPKKGARGSSGKGDPADIVWRLSNGLGGHYELRQKKRRMGWVPETVHLKLETDPLRFTMPIAQITADATALVRALDDLGVPSDAGRPACANALKEAEHPFDTNALAEAVRWRKSFRQSVQTVSGEGVQTVGSDSSAGNDGNVDAARVRQSVQTVSDSTPRPTSDSLPPIGADSLGFSPDERAEELFRQEAVGAEVRPPTINAVILQEDVEAAFPLRRCDVCGDDTIHRGDQCGRCLRESESHARQRQDSGTQDARATQGRHRGEIAAAHQDRAEEEW